MSDIDIRPILEYFGFEDSGTKSGAKVVCKFHPDDHPSGVVYDHYYKCFACGVQGDAVRLLHDQGEMGWREAQRRAEELAGAQHVGVRKVPRSRSSILGGSRVHSRNRAFVPFRSGAR